jgi:hypothetical protein
LDHAKKYCPQLLEKWHARGNYNHNPNHNVQKITTEKQNEVPRIEVVTCKGDRTWDDTMNRGKKVEK